MATPKGFEPSISTVTGWHVGPLHHGAVLRDSRGALGRRQFDRKGEVAGSLGRALAVALEGVEGGVEGSTRGRAGVDALDQGAGDGDADLQRDGEVEVGAGVGWREAVGLIEAVEADVEVGAQTAGGDDLLGAVVEDTREAGAAAPADMLTRLRVAGRRVERGFDASVPAHDFIRGAEGAPDKLDRRLDLDTEADLVQGCSSGRSLVEQRGFGALIRRKQCDCYCSGRYC